MKLTVIVPVFNEAQTIRPLIGHLRALPGGAGLEIVVVDGDPGGSTIKEIHDREVTALTSQKGRGRQMNRGADSASGDILLFLHADTFLPVNGLEQVRSAMRTEDCIGGAFQLGINSVRPIFRITERYAALRTRLTRIPFGDQAIFLRRDFFFEIGGYRDIPVMEDIDLMKRIKKRKQNIVLLPEKVLTSPRRWEREGIINCTFRNWTLQIGYALGVRPEALARWYK